MLDWNGNGKIDPVDIRISIAVDESEEQVSEIDIENNKAHANCSKSGLVSWIERMLFKK